MTTTIPCWTSVEQALDQAVSSGVTPAVSLLVARGGEILFESGAGGQEGSATVFDLSSLTKPLVTAVSVMILAADGRLSFDQPVVEVLPEFDAPAEGGGQPARSEVTVRHLLSHSSGLPWWAPFYEDVSAGELGATEEGKQLVYRLAAAQPLEAEVGATAVYSDVGYILLGWMIERITGMPLDEFASSRILLPLGLGSAGFRRIRRPLASMAAGEIAPCGPCDWRGAHVHGFVHDRNAHAMGGVAGHAGLFATARDVHLIVLDHLRALNDAGVILGRPQVEYCWSSANRVSGSTWQPGWDTPTPGASSAGRFVSDDAVGHLGFTGTSVWIDRRRGVHVVLLTNRVEAGEDMEGIRRLRPLVHDAVFSTVDGVSR